MRFNLVRKSKYKWLKSFLSKQLPWLSSFFILVLSFVFIPVYNVKATLVLIPIFFWGMKKVKCFDFIFVMLFGFIQDFLDGTQFGFNMFIFLSIYFVVFYQKFFPLDESFSFSYLAFCISTLVLILLKYFVISSMFVENINFFNILLSWAVLILCYPIFYWPLNQIYERVVSKYNA